MPAATNNQVALSNDPDMITNSIYSPTVTQWPDSQLPFEEYHMAHLIRHKLTNPETYLSNLKHMVKTANPHYNRLPVRARFAHVSASSLPLSPS